MIIIREAFFVIVSVPHRSVPYTRWDKTHARRGAGPREFKENQIYTRTTHGFHKLQNLNHWRKKTTACVVHARIETTGGVADGSRSDDDLGDHRKYDGPLCVVLCVVLCSVCLFLSVYVCYVCLCLCLCLCCVLRMCVVYIFLVSYETVFWCVFVSICLSFSLFLSPSSSLSILLFRLSPSPFPFSFPFLSPCSLASLTGGVNNPIPTNERLESVFDHGPFPPPSSLHFFFRSESS